VIHPFLFGTFPILALYARNVREIPPGELIGPVAMMLAGTFLAWLILAALLRSGQRAGILVSLGMVLFHGGSRLPQLVDDRLTALSRNWVATTVRVPPLLTITLALAAVLALGCLLTSRLKRPESITRVLNLFAIVLTALPVFDAVRAGPSLARPARAASPAAIVPGPSRLPDIYYIILDGYARSDVMKRLFDFDNSPFLERLENKGFYVARDSTSNYCQTPLSLSSSLNMSYLDEMVKGLENDQTALRDLLARNALVETLRPLGYKFVTFATGFEPTELTGADDYVSPDYHFTEFQRILIDQTVLWALLPDPSRHDMFAQARRRVLHMLDKLPEIAADRAPTFTLVHCLCPHPPFLFDEDGEDVSRRDLRYYLSDGMRYQGKTSEPGVYVRGYRGQAVYITRQIEQAFDRILANSKEPPILILQSDHGSGLRLDMQSKEKTDLNERMSILNAYYFPDRKYDRLHRDITPVNSFRVVLDTYFGGQLGLLPDRSYFSTWDEPYGFMDVTEQVRPRDDETAR
jgi:hypothetical protein